MGKNGLKNALKLLIATLVLFFGMLQTAHAADKRIGILVYDGVLTSDVTAPLEVFGVASRLTWFSDYEVLTISVSDQKTITTEEGLKIGVDAWIGDQPGTRRAGFNIKLRHGCANRKQGSHSLYSNHIKGGRLDGK